MDGTVGAGGDGATSVDAFIALLGLDAVVPDQSNKAHSHATKAHGRNFQTRKSRWAMPYVGLSIIRLRRSNER